MVANGGTSVDKFCLLTHLSSAAFDVSDLMRFLTRPNCDFFAFLFVTAVIFLCTGPSKVQFKLRCFLMLKYNPSSFFMVLLTLL